MLILAEVIHLAPLAAVGTLAIGTITLRHNATIARRTRLKVAWGEFAKTAHYVAIDLVLRAPNAAIVFDKSSRVLALTTLRALDGVARQASAVRADWETILPMEDFERVHELGQHCQQLIGVLRWSNVPVEVQCWTDSRRRALAHLRRVIGRSGPFALL